ncbi:hypothetical protein, partial [Saccharopolyspora tripterygii]
MAAQVEANADRVVLVPNSESRGVDFAASGTRVAVDLGKEVVALVDNGRGKLQWRSFQPDGSRPRVVRDDAPTPAEVTPDSRPAPIAEQESRTPAGPVASFRVEAERWKALDDAFVFGSGDGRRRVQRGRGSGVRQQVSYSVIPEVGRWNLVTKLYLRPAEGVSEADLDAVRASTTAGIESLLNQAENVLPGPNTRAHGKVVFVDDPGAADGVVEVVAGR